MLIKIREKASSLVAYVIIGLLVLSFALWGIQEYFGGGGAAPIAKVNDREISLSEFNNQFQQYKQRLQSILGDSYQQQYPDAGIIRNQVIDDMVRTEILRQAATEAGFRISDAGLIKSIQQIPQFQKDGKFDPEQYGRLLQAQRYDQAQFESELREQEKLKQFETTLVISSFMPKADLQRFQKLAEQSRDFKFSVIKVGPQAESVGSTEIEKYYNENQSLFKIPEQVRLAYIELKEDELIDQISVSTDAARVLYTAQKERHTTSELRKARHILLKVSNEIATDSEQWDAALKKANDLIKQLDDGAAFEELARQHSEDSLSAEKGGEIGFIARGDFASTASQKALFALDIGEYSKPIRTEQGIQIFKLDGIQAAEQKPFEEMEEQIINERKGQLAQQQFIDMADELANLVVEQPDDLQEASAAFDLEIKQTGRLTPSSTAEIFSFPKIQAFAFSDEILTDGVNSELIEVADGHVIAFRLLEHKSSELEPLESVTDEISKAIAADIAAEQASAQGQALLMRLQNGISLEELALENSLEIISHGALRRDDDRVAAEVIEHAFNLPHPSADSLSADGFVLPDGAFALLVLHEVIDGADQFDDEKVLQLSQRVNYGRREFNAILADMKEQSDVRIFESDL